MRILYYSTAYYAAHGGSSQSLLFFKELTAHPKVEEAWVFPKKRPAQTEGRKAGGIRGLLRSFPLMQVLFFYRRNQFYLKELFVEIRTTKPDAIVVQLDSTFLQIGYLKKVFPSLIVATQVNASPFDEPFKNIAFKSRFKKLERKSLAAADANLFVSSALRDRIMQENVNNNRDHVIQNGVETDVFIPMSEKSALRKKYQLPEHKLVIGYVGTLDHHKKVDLLLKAFGDVLRKFPEAFLVIIGNGPAFEHLTTLSKALSLDKAIKFTGWVKHDVVPEYLNTFDIAVHHHAMEYMSPLKIFEYVSVGLPVVAPDIPGVREVFTDGVHVLMTKSDEGAIANAIMKLMEDQDFAAEMARAGRELILKQYTWRQHVDQVVKALARVQP